MARQGHHRRGQYVDVCVYMFICVYIYIYIYMCIYIYIYREIERFPGHHRRGQGLGRQLPAELLGGRPELSVAS